MTDPIDEYAVQQLKESEEEKGQQQLSFWIML